MTKKIVMYDPAMGVQRATENRVYLYPTDHPSPLVSNTCAVRTSRVINYDEATGIVETENTLYHPLTKSMQC